MGVRREDIAMRSCWECNPAHEYLKRAPGVFWCFSCGRVYEDGKFLTERSE